MANKLINKYITIIKNFIYTKLIKHNILSNQKIIIHNQNDFDLLIKDFNNAPTYEDQKKVFSKYEINFRSFFNDYDLLKKLDPFSEEYRLMQIKRYEILSQRKYDPNISESFDFAINDIIKQPFPYSGTVEDVANLLEDTASCIRHINPKKNEYILEMGSGWGNLVEPLSKMGCKVYCCDVNPCFSKLAEKRCENSFYPVTTYNCGFLDIEQYIENGLKFDKIIFHAAFHHCENPYELLKLIHRISSTDAILFLFNESIGNFDIPWGIVRNDGETARAIRREGWMELGFDRKFFFDLLKRTGWEGSIIERNEQVSSIIAKKK